jgi:hypothetical protein
MAVTASGCGSASDSTVERQVAKTMAATSGHAVSKVAVRRASPIRRRALSSTASDLTCRISFADGTKPQLWAVRVADFTVTSAVEPLYQLDDLGRHDRHDHDACAPVPPDAFATISGKRVLSVRCTVAAGLKAGADHRCRAVFADHSQSVWAVKTVAAYAQLLLSDQLIAGRARSLPRHANDVGSPWARWLLGSPR